MGRLDVRDPIADGGAHRLLQRAGAGVDRNHLGAEQSHPLDVGSLAANVLGPHVDDAFEIEQRAGGRRGDAVLTGAGLGDDATLAHPLRQQRLPDRIVDLVRAGVGEVLALQVHRPAGPLGEPLGQVQRRGTADEVAVQAGEPAAEFLVLPGGGPGIGQLVERPDQRLGNVAAAIRPEARIDIHAHQVGTLAVAAASKKAVIAAWSLRPGSASTPLATSTA